MRHTSRWARNRALLCGVAAFTLACGRLHMGSDEDQSLVIFANQSLDQVDVYAAVSGGGEIRRLGTVMSNHTDTLVVPSTIANRAGINILARIFASNRVLATGPTAIARGSAILVQLPSTELNLSVLPAP